MSSFTSTSRISPSAPREYMPKPDSDSEIRDYGDTDKPTIKLSNESKVTPSTMTQHPSLFLPIAYDRVSPTANNLFWANTRSYQCRSSSPTSRDHGERQKKKGYTLNADMAPPFIPHNRQQPYPMFYDILSART